MRQVTRAIRTIAAVPRWGASANACYLALLAVAAVRERMSADRTPVPDIGSEPHRLAILVPAHDEAQLIATTVEQLLRLDYPETHFEVHVVADHCTDDTAALAKDAGAHVHEHDEDPRGKGPALNWVLSQVANRPDAFVIIDADSTPEPEFLHWVDQRLHAGAKVVQAHYAVKDPGSAAAVAIRAAAFALRHHLRPAGRQHLGLSAGLFGNGMVFRTELLEDHRWSSHLTEDIEMHLDLLRSGEVVAFEPRARLEAEMPDTLEGARQQNLRWEQGRSNMAGVSVGRLPRDLAGRSFIERIRLVESVVDQLVPPFSVAVAMAGAGSLFDVATKIVRGSGVPLRRSWLVVGAVQTASVVIALRLSNAPRSVWVGLVRAPLAIAWKFRLYAVSLLGLEQATWTRTRRNDEDVDVEVVEPGSSTGDGEPPLALIGGLPLHRLTMESALDAIVDLVQRGKKTGEWFQAVTVNTDYLANAKHDPALAALLAEADLLTADGMPLVWASRWHGCALPERVAGADLVPLLSERCAQLGHRVFLMGAGEGVAESAAEMLRSRHPELAIEGSGCSNFDDIEEMDQDVLDRITTFEPDVVLVALGHPKQEFWIRRYGEQTGASVLMGIGGSLDFLTGATQRAPGPMRALGLEWVHRLSHEPRRLAPRYARDIIEATGLLRRPGIGVSGPRGTHSGRLLEQLLIDAGVGLIVAGDEVDLCLTSASEKHVVVDLSCRSSIDIDCCRTLVGERRRRRREGGELLVFAPDAKMAEFFVRNRLDIALNLCRTEAEISSFLQGRAHG